MNEPAQPGGTTRGQIDFKTIERRQLVHTHEQAVLRLEGRLLNHTRTLTHALDQVMKTFTLGYSDSMLTGAVADLRHAANNLEIVNKDWRAEQAQYYEAIRMLDIVANT